jgi:ABC-2 type transport system ATP-binding protein
MKRRVLIAKALSHEPKILFLDEPTAGVDVELRKDMWAIVRKLRASGVTIILTTHYIEEAEEIADRVGVINNGELLLVEEKDQLMANFGKKQLVLELSEPVESVPESLSDFNLEVSEDGCSITYTYDPTGDGAEIADVLQAISKAGLAFKDLKISQSSLEDIFVDLVRGAA